MREFINNRELEVIDLTLPEYDKNRPYPVSRISDGFRVCETYICLREWNNGKWDVFWKKIGETKSKKSKRMTREEALKFIEDLKDILVIDC